MLRQTAEQQSIGRTLNRTGQIAPPSETKDPHDPASIDDLRLAVTEEIEALELGAAPGDKAGVRRSHARQRRAVWTREFVRLHSRLGDLLHDFAAGSEIEPAAIQPRVTLVASDSRDADLFRLGTLLWSVPVSRGYGRRMRFLVRDDHNGKIIGLFALGDPVFNLRARDSWVGWSSDDRRERLVNVMDAFVVGSVPPYSSLLGGKLVTSLIGSREVGEIFAARYRDTSGVISGAKKAPKLALVTVTSALGRSSLYNRLKLVDAQKPAEALVDLQPIGWTSGYGHFQISNELFARLRAFLASRGHAYADGHQYGDGPNWRMRVVRVALAELGLDPLLLRHGIERQVFAMPLAVNFREYLRGTDSEAVLRTSPISTISAAALRRWVVPRSSRFPSYRSFEVTELEQLLRHASEVPTAVAASDDVPGVGGQASELSVSEQCHSETADGVQQLVRGPL